MISMVLGHLSSPVLLQVLWCPHLYCIYVAAHSSSALVNRFSEFCICSAFSRIWHYFYMSKSSDFLQFKIQPNHFCCENLYHFLRDCPAIAWVTSLFHKFICTWLSLLFLYFSILQHRPTASLHGRPVGGKWRHFPPPDFVNILISLLIML